MPEKKMTIWFASSDSENRKILSDKLKKQNYQVKLFENGISAAEELKKNLPDYFIMDFLLDIIDGMKFCEYLKRDSRYKNIPVILLLREDAPDDFRSKADLILRKKDKENLVLKLLAALSSLINGEAFPVHLWENADRRSPQIKQVSPEIFELRGRFDSVFEKNVAGILEIDDKQRIISMNSRMEEILQQPVLDLIGDNLFKRFPLWKKSLKEYLATGEVAEKSIIHEHNGRYFETRTSYVVKDDKKSGHFLMFFDVTERQLYQKKLLSHAEELEKEVERRLHQIRTANSELERLNRLKSEFLSNISHEMRTPLATIKGFTETLMNRDVKPDDRREFLGIIASESARLEKIVNEILDITQIQQGLMKRQLALTCFNISAELDYVIKLLDPVAKKKKIRIIIAEDFSGLKIKADRDRIRQVLINIIENAVKFSPDATDIILKLIRDKREVVFSCEDQGPGIPEAEKERIFEKFYMVDGSDRRSQKGTGVGLFIADNIVKLHNGKIEVSSGKRKGCTFIVRLPVNIRNIREDL
jgi:signal transduction histidine kinase/CheY-like chemotaxis protein